MPGNAGGGKEPWFESGAEWGKGVTTGESLAGSEKVRKLQTDLHAKAEEEPDRRFHALIDKVWREDFFEEAWRRVRASPPEERREEPVAGRRSALGSGARPSFPFTGTMEAAP